MEPSDLSFGMLAAAVAAAGGAVSVTESDLLRFNAEHMVVIEQGPDNILHLILRRRPGATPISEILRKVENERRTDQDEPA